MRNRRLRPIRGACEHGVPERHPPHHHQRLHADRRRPHPALPVAVQERQRSAVPGARPDRVRLRRDARGQGDPGNHRSRCAGRHAPARRRVLDGLRPPRHPDPQEADGAARAPRRGRCAPLKVVIAGAGIAGSILAYALHHTSGVDVQCLERAGRADQSEAGTGLNIGPNAIKALAAHAPDLHPAGLGVSILWRNWRVSLANGTVLMDLPLERVAENPGIRLRWSELYRVLRSAAAPRIRFGTEVVSRGSTGARPGHLFVEARRGEERFACNDVDLLVAADGRYSRVRKDFCGPPPVRHIGVAMFRLLAPDTSGGLIDDYEQWFNGPHRLLDSPVPHGASYTLGSVPIAPQSTVPEECK